MISKCKGLSLNDKPCTKYASYGYKGKNREYCINHKKIDMVNEYSYICAYGECESRAAFGFSKEDIKLYCGKHKEFGY